jgi:hypothetical protein
MGQAALGFALSSEPRRPGADDARQGGDRPSSTGLKLRLRHQPNLRSHQRATSCRNYSHDYYGSSDTPRRQQRTVRLPRTPKSSAGTAGTSTHTPVGRVGAQLYPGGIAAVYRNTARGLARPTDKRADETVLSENKDRASRQPIAASSGLLS